MNNMRVNICKTDCLSSSNSDKTEAQKNTIVIIQPKKNKYTKIKSNPYKPIGAEVAYTNEKYVYE